MRTRTSCMSDVVCDRNVQRERETIIKVTGVQKRMHRERRQRRNLHDRSFSCGRGAMLLPKHQRASTGGRKKGRRNTEEGVRRREAVEGSRGWAAAAVHAARRGRRERAEGEKTKTTREKARANWRHRAASGREQEERIRREKERERERERGREKERRRERRAREKRR